MAGVGGGLGQQTVPDDSVGEGGVGHFLLQGKTETIVK